MTRPRLQSNKRTRRRRSKSDLTRRRRSKSDLTRRRRANRQRLMRSMRVGLISGYNRRSRNTRKAFGGNGTLNLLPKPYIVSQQPDTNKFIAEQNLRQNESNRALSGGDGELPVLQFPGDGRANENIVNATGILVATRAASEYDNPTSTNN